MQRNGECRQQDRGNSPVNAREVVGLALGLTLALTQRLETALNTPQAPRSAQLAWERCPVLTLKGMPCNALWRAMPHAPPAAAPQTVAALAALEVETMGEAVQAS